jgi:acyl dehydratase
MPINLSQALANPPRTTAIAWRPDDVILYHLATGSGVPPGDPAELRYVTEDDLAVLPSFAVVAPTLRAAEPPKLDWPGLDVDLSHLLHGSQRIDVFGPLPPSAQAVASERVAALQDKGKAAVIELETAVSTPSGEPMWTSAMRIFARGEGGFGGERGQPAGIRAPERSPDFRFETPTLPQQALLYRLLGDRNPLHSDPGVAKAAGFPRPILHGLCTYAMVLKGALREALGNDIGRVRSYEGVFTGVVFPGETIRTSGWQDGDRLYLMSAVGERDDAPVLSAQLTAAAELS